MTRAQLIDSIVSDMSLWADTTITPVTFWESVRSVLSTWRLGDLLREARLRGIPTKDVGVTLPPEGEWI
jgi:hypothetical protein